MRPILPTIIAVASSLGALLFPGCSADGRARYAHVMPGDPPARLVVPSARQLKWQELEYYAFVHFNMNTFTGIEWGTGGESPALFNPTQLDCDQWVKTFKDAGMKGVIITAKHHDGFCLWPSKLTKHGVASSPWKNGQGDVLADLSNACRRHGLKFGLYISPWDRNSPFYGDSPRYNQYFCEQLREVLTNYGPVFEVWFDGACGEGPNGKRQEYDWKLFVQTVRECQPDAVIFSDAGPDIRWVGNENGFANDTNWSMLHRSRFFPGTPLYAQLTGGHRDGTDWVPAECDVSIRPGWYYHADQDNAVKPVDALLNIYHRSVGSNGSLLLNIPVDRRGLVHENDARRLMEFKAALDRLYMNNVAHTARATATTQYSDSPDPARHAPGNTIDGDRSTIWAAAGHDKLPSITIHFSQSRTPARIVLSEPLAFGQRIAGFSVFAGPETARRRIGSGTTIGNKRILMLEPVATTSLTVVFDESDGPPMLSEIEIYEETAPS